MGFYEDKRDNLAFKNIKKYGMAATLQVVSGESFDDVTGLTTAGTTKSYSTYVLLYPYKQGSIDGTSIRQGDLRVYMENKTLAVVPTVKDTMLVSGVKYEIVSITPLNPGGITVLYEVQLRA